ncbi:unnamed protein product [Cyprideis torosa]|uniref:Uncharacterized protein n=1 Tax=Cyprideis torosa TaxID=163714 RepID=A0A7R8W458_9CRUS|nr:unnamed protein product [Cyprideis torosa]CAG0883782.1 unnamed protein product [Cyprideis torosa]
MDYRNGTREGRGEKRTEERDRSHVDVGSAGYTVSKADADYHQISLAMPRSVAVQLARLDYQKINSKMIRQPSKFHNRPPGTLLELLVHNFLTLSPHDTAPCIKAVQGFLMASLLSMEKVYERAHSGDEEGRVVRWQRPYISEKSEIALLLQTLQSLVRFTGERSACKKLIRGGLLPLLLETQIFYSRKNNSIMPLIAHILSNISVFEEFHNDLYVSGWIAIACDWLRQSSSVDLTIHAAKILYNMDQSCSGHRGRLGRLVFLLHPLFDSGEKRRKKVSGDVVFIHGLLGGVCKTWRQNDRAAYIHQISQESLSDLLLNTSWMNYLPETFLWKVKKQQPEVPPPPSTPGVGDRPESTPASPSNGVATTPNQPQRLKGLRKTQKNQCKQCAPDVRCQIDVTSAVVRNCTPNPNYAWCWPMKWLSRDSPSTRVLGVSYFTSLSSWKALCPEKDTGSIRDRSANMLKQLVQAEIGKRPIIFVAHSMGGILVKEMIRQAMASSDESLRSFLNQIKGIIFLSVPHKGTPLAKWSPNIQAILAPTGEVQELAHGSEFLHECHQAFLKFLREHPDTSITSFGEKQELRLSSVGLKLIIVSETSANPGVGSFTLLDANHLDVCKPMDRASPVYQALLQMIEEKLGVYVHRDVSSSVSSGNGTGSGDGSREAGGARGRRQPTLPPQVVPSSVEDEASAGEPTEASGERTDQMDSPEEDFA